MKVLITGCAGFIGSNFAKFLLQQEPQVFLTNLDSLSYTGNLQNLSSILNHPRHKFIKGHICNKELVERLIKKSDPVVNDALKKKPTS